MKIAEIVKDYVGKEYGIDDEILDTKKIRPLNFAFCDMVRDDRH